MFGQHPGDLYRLRTESSGNITNLPISSRAMTEPFDSARSKPT